MPDEIFIERRPNRISIQRDGIGNDETETRELLQAALDALNSDRQRELLQAALDALNSDRQRELLQAALDALNSDRQRENWGGEIVIHDEKKDDDE